MNDSNYKLDIDSLIKRDAQSAAVISKLISNPNGVGGRTTKEQTAAASNRLLQISEQMKRRFASNSDILQMFPDLEMVVQILITAITSPKDMVTTELIYSSSYDVLSEKTRLDLLEQLRQEINRVYKIEEDIYDILRDILFAKGSHVRMVMPESSLDDIIHDRKTVTAEAVSHVFEGDFTEVKPKGFLGPAEAPKKTTLAIESFLQAADRTNYGSKVKLGEMDVGVEIIDNWEILKLPLVTEAARRERDRELIHGERITVHHSLHTENSQKAFRDAKKTVKTFLRVPGRHDSSRLSVGRPLHIEIPPESCIPIYPPGSEDDHMGYVVLIDTEGNFVNRMSNRTGIDVIGTSVNEAMTANRGSQSVGVSSGDNLTYTLIERAKQNLIDTTQTPTIDNIVSVYGSVVEADFEKRLANGGRQGQLRLEHNDNIYRMLLARRLQGQATRILYVPKELISYYAFRYHENGVGKSMIDDMRPLLSYRAAMQVASILGQIKNSINIQVGTIQFDPNDPDPLKTFEQIRAITNMTRAGWLPAGITSISDLNDWAQQLGMEWGFEGHPEMPNTKVDFESRANNHTLPSGDLDELLRKQTYLNCGVPPELVDNSLDAEFATTVIATNLMMSKRVSMIQKIIAPHFAKNIRMLAENDATIAENLQSLIAKDLAAIKTRIPKEYEEMAASNERLLVETIYEEFVASLEVGFPSADVSSIKSQTEAFTDYMEAMEKSIDYWISSKVVKSEFSGEVANNIESIKEQLLSYYARKWQSDNGYLTELSELTATDEEGSPRLNLLKLIEAHTDALLGGVLCYMKDAEPRKQAADQDIQNIGSEVGSGTTETEGTDTGGGGDNPEDEFSTDFGGDDLGGGPTEPATGDEPPADGEVAPSEEPTSDEQTDKDA